MQFFALLLTLIISTVAAKIPLVYLEPTLDITLRYMRGSLVRSAPMALKIFRVNSGLWPYTADYLTDLICNDEDQIGEHGENYPYKLSLHRQLAQMFDYKDRQLEQDEIMRMKDFYQKVMFPLYEVRLALIDYGKPMHHKLFAPDEFMDRCRKFNILQLYEETKGFFVTDCEWGSPGCLLINTTIKVPSYIRNKWTNVFLPELSEVQILTSLCALCLNDLKHAQQLLVDYQNAIDDIVKYIEFKK